MGNHKVNWKDALIVGASLGLFFGSMVALWIMTA